LNPKLKPLPAASNAFQGKLFLKYLIVSQKLMKYKEKTLNGEGPNLSSIPELLGFVSKNLAVLLVDR
jgi:hypothetical protein